MSRLRGFEIVDRREGWSATEGHFIRFEVAAGVRWFWADLLINDRETAIDALHQDWLT